jgi:hypothetical protein
LHEESDMKDPVDNPVSASDPDPGEILERVRSLIQSVNGFVHLTPSWRRKINSAATLPDRFYQLGSLALDANEWLANTSQLSGPEVRSSMDFSGRVLSLASELELLAKGLRSTAAARRGSVGERLLFAYTVGRRYNRTEGAEVIPYIEEMEAILRARRRRRGTKTEEGEPED